VKSILWSVTVGCALGALPFVCNIAGYGSYWRFTWPWFALVAVLLVIAFVFRWTRSFRSSRMSRRTCIFGIAFVVICTGLSGFAGDHVRRFYCRGICRACEPLLAAIEAHKRAHGQYPARLEDIRDFRAIRDGLNISIQQGEVRETGVSVDNIKGVDATMYLEPDQWLCIVPIQKKCFLSITRFTIYARSSLDDDWRYDYMIWTLGVIGEKNSSK